MIARAFDEITNEARSGIYKAKFAIYCLKFDCACWDNSMEGKEFLGFPAKEEYLQNYEVEKNLSTPEDS